MEHDSVLRIHTSSANAKLIETLEQADVMAQITIDDRLAIDQIVVSGDLMVEICVDAQALEAALSREKRFLDQQPVGQEYAQVTYLLLVKETPIQNFLTTLNLQQTGRPILFYLAQDIYELPDLLLNIASNVENRAEFRDYMEKVQEELQENLLDLQ